jgi:hypothetical protein
MAGPLCSLWMLPAFPAFSYASVESLLNLCVHSFFSHKILMPSSQTHYPACPENPFKATGWTLIWGEAQPWDMVFITAVLWALCWREGGDSSILEALSSIGKTLCGLCRNLSLTLRMISACGKPEPGDSSGDGGRGERVVHVEASSPECVPWLQRFWRCRRLAEIM